MTKGRIIFTGNFWEYFFTFLGIAILTIVTFGILLPYLVYWSQKWFFQHLDLEIFEA